MAFNFINEQGAPQTVSDPTKAPGKVGYQSSALTPGGLSTVDADPFNAFKGYVGPQGGTFGGYDKSYGDRAKAFQDGLQVDWSKVDPTKLGALGKRTPNANGALTDARDSILERGVGGGELSPEEQAFLRLSRDPTSGPFRLSGLADGSAATYDKNIGLSMGIGPDGKPLDQSGDYYAQMVAVGAATPEQAASLRAKAAQAQQAPEAAPTEPVNADPFGQFESPTAANNVIKPNQNRLEAPMTNADSIPDPFAPFIAGASPAGAVGANAGATQAVGGIQPTTFANAIDPTKIQPPDGGGQPPAGGPGFAPVEGNVPLPGGVITKFAPPGGPNPWLPSGPAPSPHAPVANAGGFGGRFRPLGGLGRGRSGLYDRFKPIKRNDQQTAGMPAAAQSY